MAFHPFQAADNSTAGTMPRKRKRDSPPELSCQTSSQRGTKRHRDSHALKGTATGSAIAEAYPPERGQVMRRVLNELSKMEEKLQEQAKQQRLLIQSSNCGVCAENAAQAAARWANNPAAAEQVLPGTAPANGAVADNEFHNCNDRGSCL